MAYISDAPGRKGLLRVRYSIDGRERKKYVRGREGSQRLKTALSDLEQAARTGVAHAPKIRHWIAEEYLSATDARNIWPGIGETLRRMGGISRSFRVKRRRKCPNHHGEG